MKPKIDPSLFISTKEDLRLAPFGFGHRTCLDGTKGPKVIIFVKEPTMMHDFAITKNYVMVPSQKTMCININGKQYGALNTWEEQKKAFNEHLAQRKKQEVKKRHKRQKRDLEYFVKMLECKELASTMEWRKIGYLFEKDKLLLSYVITITIMLSQGKSKFEPAHGHSKDFESDPIKRKHIYELAKTKFLPSLKYFDKDNIPPATIERIRPYPRKADLDLDVSKRHPNCPWDLFLGTGNERLLSSYHYSFLPHGSMVYEFMGNGTLRDHLSANSKRPLDFAMRFRIATGSARGILYLHNEANPPISHRDIKAGNILVDEKYNTRVADFGLSKLAPLPNLEESVPSHVSAVVKGTPGYLEPEYFLTHKLIDKSDVYSFGVVLHELLTSMQPISYEKNIVREPLVRLAMSCCKDETDARSSMVDVVHELENILQLTPGLDTTLIHSGGKLKTRTNICRNGLPSPLCKINDWGYCSLARESDNIDRHQMTPLGDATIRTVAHRLRCAVAAIQTVTPGRLRSNSTRSSRHAKEMRCNDSRKYRRENINRKN
eukprot:Gb_16687 [translate_table: standard]